MPPPSSDSTRSLSLVRVLPLRILLTPLVSPRVAEQAQPVAENNEC